MNKNYVRCIFCDQKIHIDHFAGVFGCYGLDWYYCDNVVCLIEVLDIYKKGWDLGRAKIRTSRDFARRTGELKTASSENTGKSTYPQGAENTGSKKTNYNMAA